MGNVLNCFEMWWPGTELNRRRQPFQGCALPPELPGHVSKPTLPWTTRTCSLHADCGGIAGRATRIGCRSVRNVTDYSNGARFPQCRTAHTTRRPHLSEKVSVKLQPAL